MNLFNAEITNYWGLIVGLFLVLVVYLFKTKPSGYFLYPIEKFRQAPISAKLLLFRFTWHAIFLLLITAISLGASKPVMPVYPQNDSGRSIFLVIDTSFSMREKDFYEGVSRYTRMEGVKKVVTNFIKNRYQDLIGISIFAGKSYLLSPLSKNQKFLLDSINSLQPGIGGDGTAVGDGLAIALKKLQQVSSESKAIVLVTDGASNAGLVKPEVAAQVAKSLNIKIHAIGIGQKDTQSYDEKNLQHIANLTGGTYGNAEDYHTLTQVTKEIEKLLESKTDSTVNIAYKHYSRWFALLSLLLLIAFFIFDKFIYKRYGLESIKTKNYPAYIIVSLLLLIAVISPSIGQNKLVVKNNQIRNFFFLLDLSKSMDVSDQYPSRLAKAKEEIVKALRFKVSSPNDYYSLITFAGVAQTVSPITVDKEAIIKTVETIDSNLISQGGSNIAEAIQLANSNLISNRGAIFLLSDGETDQKDITLVSAKNSTLPIISLVFGTTNGGKIPGSDIISKSDPHLLKELSQNSNGFMTEKITFNELDISSSTKPSEEIVIKNEVGWVFLLITLVSLLWFQFKKKTPVFIPSLIVVFFIIDTALAQDIKSVMGERKYNQQMYKEASKLFEESLTATTDDPQLWAKKIRLGSSKFKEENFEESTKIFKESIDYAKEPQQKFHSYYNLGNSYLWQDKFDEAIENYNHALVINPNDYPTQVNRKIAEERKKQKNDLNKNKQPPEDKNNNQPQNNRKDNQPESSDESLSSTQNQAKQWLESLPDAPLAIKKNDTISNRQTQWW